MRSTPLYSPRRVPPRPQLRRRGPVLDEDGDVVHQPAQGFGDLVEGVADQPLEIFRAHFHQHSLAQFDRHSLANRPRAPLGGQT